MSVQHQDSPKITKVQAILAILGISFALPLLIYVVVKIVLGLPAMQAGNANSEAAAARIAERIQPVATVDVAAAAGGARVDRGGEEIYKAVCLACHTTGALNSPKLGDKAAWAPRIAQGYETLVKHAIEGIRMMPPRGGNPDLTDGEVANAVAYLANESGGKFTPPAPAAAEAAPAAEVPANEAAPAADSAKAVAARSGEEVSKSVCMVCHGAGVMGAPKIGDKAGWAPRIAQGYDTLVSNAIKGVRMMPAKGGDPSLTDAEVAAAVVHMANQSGAKFKSPQ